jgi:hypothetical protein
MRRLVLVCLLLVLPLQWPWAALAGGCCPDCACAAEHGAAGGGERVPTGPAEEALDAGAAFDAAASPCDVDCLHCQGPGPAVLIDAAATPGAPIGERCGGRYALHLPDPVPDLPLRPPRA